jgi:hypothetical protein
MKLISTFGLAIFAVITATNGAAASGCYPREWSSVAELQLATLAAGGSEPIARGLARQLAEGHARVPSETEALLALRAAGGSSALAHSFLYNLWSGC